MTTPTGLLAWGQAGTYDAVDDRTVITALANGRSGIQSPAVLSAGSGLVVNLAPGWLAVVPCQDGTFAVVGSRLTQHITVPAGPATGSTTSYIWCDVNPDAATWTINVITPAQASGRTGIQLGTVIAPANANTAAAMTLTPSPASYGSQLAVAAPTSFPPPASGNIIVASVTFTLARRTSVDLRANVTGTNTGTQAAPDPRMMLTITPSANGGMILAAAYQVFGPSLGMSGSQIIDLQPGVYTFALQVFSQAGWFTCTAAKLWAVALL